MHVPRRILLSASLFALLAAGSAQAMTHAGSHGRNKPTDAADDSPSQAENVRIEYAQVLDVVPVYATAGDGRSEAVCDEVTIKANKAGKSNQAQASTPGRWSRFWSRVKGWFGGGADEHADDAAPEKPAAKAKTPAPTHCHGVSQDGQTQLPVAYDVDYVYRGMKFRARLPQDPGSRLRIRLTVAPYGVSSQALDAHD